ncbi:hypothetical protein [Sphingopyxis macrogoltabida]|uniref:Uncharacterized protein n=1 Tax=Sphingopyxis macrogoltabida TaxID=33050 RepID=A0A0N9U7M7_SPHMC|nr:hypothetical protein [Sphingopyxis macrogoltabida]ALH78825.1 hypothetical protein AN936_00065 [Sphingopyxis macrogoltabida]
MRKPTILSLAAAALLLPAASPAAAPGAAEWEIGPIIRGRNYSQAMPLRPQPTRTGWRFDFPVGDSPAAGHVHYVTYRPAPIAPGSRIIVRYRVDARAGTRFVPQERPDLPATVSLYFQRRGDNWTARGRYERFRWYAPAATVRKIARGEHEMIVRLDDPNWISVNSRSAKSDSGALEAALADIDRIGLVFGSSAARGHGVYATAPARFTLLSFRIEPAGQGSRDVG